MSAAPSYPSYPRMAHAASGHDPYPWQERVAEQGLPELIAIETGAGKTAGVVLPWLWRRRYHPDLGIRKGTPRWLVLCLPLRTLVEQTETAVRTWLAGLGLSDEVLVHVAMGGREDGHAQWRLHPERDAVVLGTVDMLMSRALNRGYGTGRFSWPIDFGLLHNGAHWVYDEVQLLGPALATGRQLQGLREAFGTALPTSSTWMSATVDRPALSTVDNPDLGTVLELSDADRADPAFGRRLRATRKLEEVSVEPGDPKRALRLAEIIAGAHRPGTLTLAVVNTVKAARELSAALAKASGTPVTLLHSRFRPPDRRAVLTEALADVDPAGCGRIVVSTQVVEAGVDLSATVLFTEAAPWPSIVQRAGRCNRDGLAVGVRLLWAQAKPAPYPEADVAATVTELRRLEGAELTSTALRGADVSVTQVSHAVLRRRDLLGLFDTAPDLSGNDIDVAPFIRVTDELDLQVAWRDLGGSAPEADELPPHADELCPVPVGKELRGWLTQGHALWRLDHLADRDSRWTRVRPAELRPGLVLLADAGGGGYSPATGWDPGARHPVVPVRVPTGLPGPVLTGDGLGDDTLSQQQEGWLGLQAHLADVEHETRNLLEALDPQLSADLQEAAAVAGRLHDIGKAHAVFQDTMIRCAPEPERDMRRAEGPWAKSGGGRARHRQRYFRHELVSALVLLGDARPAVSHLREEDVAVYLVAAHHGRVRLSIRSVPEEERTGFVLGVRREGDRMPAVQVPGGRLPVCEIDLDVAMLGSDEKLQPSWSARTLGLRDRSDLGPLRLAFLEAVVRLADWRASAQPGGGS